MPAARRWWILWASVSPRAVLLGHGGATARQWVEDQIRDRHPKIKVLQPAPGSTVEV